jgi:hypothetical protein
VVIADLRTVYLDTLLALPPSIQAPPHTHPWYKKPAQRSTLHLNQARRTRQWQAWMNMGKGDLKKYQHHQKAQFQALQDLIHSAGKRVKQWVIIRMAEHSRLRTLTPEFLKLDLSSSALSKRFKRPIQVWDASTLLPDSLFFDYAHLNKEGRTQFTHALIKYLKQHYADAF